MSSDHDRRTVLVGLGAAAVAIVAGVPAAADPVFDPAAFCADLHAAGLDVWLTRPVGPGGGRPSCFIVPGSDGRPTPAELDVLARWSDAMGACPDHVDRVAAHLALSARWVT